MIKHTHIQNTREIKCMIFLLLYIHSFFFTIYLNCFCVGNTHAQAAVAAAIHKEKE